MEACIALSWVRAKKRPRGDPSGVLILSKLDPKRRGGQELAVFGANVGQFGDIVEVLQFGSAIPRLDILSKTFVKT